MTVGERIKSKRDELNISQTDLARKVGVSKQTLYKYETNIVTNIPSNIIEHIATILNVSPCYLMGWNDKTLQKKKDTEADIENQKATYTDCKLQKIIGYYNEMNDIGKNELVDQAEYIKSKHPKIKAEDRVM